MNKGQTDFFSKPTGIQCAICKVRIQDYNRHVNSFHHKVKEKKFDSIFSEIDKLKDLVNDPKDSKEKQDIALMVAKEKQINKELKQQITDKMKLKHPELLEWFKKCFPDLKQIGIENT